MKRIGLMFVGLMLLIGNVVAQDVMVVTKKDGTKTTFNIGSVQDISFISSEDIDISINEIVPTSTTSFIVKYSVSTVGKINECGVCYGLDATADANKIVGTCEDGEGAIEIEGLNFSTTYHLRAYANIDGELYYSDILPHTTPTKYPTAELVDLGLSVKWASHDLGAVNENNVGLHLPWGDVTGEAYNASTYPSDLNITDYDISGSKYDIATHEWGGEWRMPSIEEFKELWDNTTKTLIRNYGYDDLTVIKFTAANGNYIILSLGGYKENAELAKYGAFGFYWTSNLPEENNGWPAAWGLQSASNGYQSSANKYFGLLIRPVYGKRADTESDGVERDYVDLGLSRLWATVNYGANTPGDAGTYVAWGEDAAKDAYNLGNYQHYKDSSYVEIDNLTESGFDVVANTWGGKWHTPTYAEFEELRTECTWTWATEKNSQGYDVAGYKVTSKTNGNSIFLPVNGEIYEGTQYFSDYGRYWTSEQYVGEEEWAYILSFSDKTINLGGKTKYRGCAIRPVRKR